MSHLNTSFEPDIDSFLNLDQVEYPSATTSPNTQQPSLAHQSSSSSNRFASSSNTQTFSGPSFQYDAYRQQTGLPVGALANTFAINQASGLQHYDGQGGFVMPNETIHLPLSKVEDLDFNRPFDFNEMDFEDDSPSDLPTMFYPSSSSSQFVSPTTLVSSNTSPSTSTPVQRIYPGMHSQAAQAKAQQAQQKQQELIRQQQQPRQIPGQKPLPKTQPAKDPQVEESISRILSQMRQKSVASVDDEDDDDTPGVSMPRFKKDEEDMDEDERLLASEEGKKLSSKERRQLRNKVSARAFRSRRKEYIGQLEGEVQSKVDEANALRTENRQLREENNRLTDLTRMLLSSPAFTGFLQELNQSGLPETSRQQQPRQERAQPQPQPTRKDVNPHDAARQLHSQQPQVGMALVPEANVDLSLYDIPSWTSTIPATDYHVFAVTEVPQGPTLDLAACTGKADQPTVLSSKLDKMLPSLPKLPEQVKEAKSEAEVQTTELSTTTAIPVASTAASALAFGRPLSAAGPVLKSKPTMDVHMIESDADGAASWEYLRAMCTEMEVAAKRLAQTVPGMDFD